MPKHTRNSEKPTAGQSDRFRDAAREVGADDSDDALERAFGKLNVKQPPAKKASGMKKTQDK